MEKRFRACFRARGVLARALAVLAGCSVVALCLVASAIAGDVRGTLQVSGVPTAEAQVPGPDAYYWEVWNGVIEPREARLDPAREFTVVLVGNGTNVGSADYAISNGDFAPRTLVVRAGAQLRIENTDRCSHELFVDGFSGFSPLSTAPGSSRTVSVPAPGSWVIRDKVYSHVRGYLVALPNLIARAEMKTSGEYVFSGVAPGAYELRIYFHDHMVGSRAVEIPADARELVVEPVQVNLAATN